MLGFIIGTVCLIGLVKVLRRGAGHGGGYGGGCGGGGWGRRFRGGWGEYDGGSQERRGFGGRWGGWGGPGFMLRGVFEHLDASPAQEKVISAAFHEVKDEVAKHRAELRQSRADVARAMRSESFDEVLLGELFARHDTVMEAMRRTVTGALARIHVVLDEKQRERLAELIESGPGAFRPRRSRGYEV